MSDIFIDYQSFISKMSDISKKNRTSPARPEGGGDIAINQYFKQLKKAVKTGN